MKAYCVDMLLTVAFGGVAGIITGKWTNALRVPCHLITTVLLQDFFQSGTKTYQELNEYKEGVRGHPFGRLWVDGLKYFQSGLLSLVVRVGDGLTVGQGVHAGQLATIASHLVHCCVYVKLRTCRPTPTSGCSS